MSNFSLSPNQHIRIRMRGEYIITRKVSDEAWEIENVTTGELCHLTESDLLQMYVDGEMVFSPATADSESLRLPTDPPQSAAVRYILEQVDVLCSPLDVFIVDETSGVTLGQPYLAVVVHRPTNAVLGVNVSLDGRAAAMLGAIKHSIMPKSRIAQEFPDLKNWECYGVPWVMMFDVGDRCSLAELERISLLLGIEVRYSPLNLIRVGEKFFRGLNQMLSCECGANPEGDAKGRTALSTLFKQVIK